MAFNLNGSFLATGSMDGMARLIPVIGRREFARVTQNGWV